MLISALFWRGNEYKVLRKAFEGEFELLTSQAIIAELEGVLSKKFGAPKGWVEKVIEILTLNSITINPKHRLDVVEDESDNRILECAIEGAADYIISGDAHLLKLREYRGIRILKSKDFFMALFE